MGATEFRPKLAPTVEPLTFTPTEDNYAFLTDCFKPRTLLLLGALLQVLLHTTLPLRWAIVPASILLLNALITTILQLLSSRPNAFTSRVIHGRTTAQTPLADGTFGAQPAAQPLVVFNLGVQWNHPLGVLAPGVFEISQQFTAMQRNLESRRDELGFLGISSYRGNDRGSNNTLLLAMHFRDVKSIHRFAHEPLHREAWDWYDVKKHSHIGIFHETFCVPAKAWENVYVNCHPVGMGRMSTVVDSRFWDRADGKGVQKWANPLVSADKPALKTQYTRLSRHENGVPMDIKSDAQA